MLVDVFCHLLWELDSGPTVKVGFFFTNFCLITIVHFFFLRLLFIPNLITFPTFNERHPQIHTLLFINSGSFLSTDPLWKCTSSLPYFTCCKVLALPACQNTDLFLFFINSFLLHFFFSLQIKIRLPYSLFSKGLLSSFSQTSLIKESSWI